MLLLPILAALLGCASAFQQSLGRATDASSVALLEASTESLDIPATPERSECPALVKAINKVDTAVEAAVHASKTGLASLLVCRRAQAADCRAFGGAVASATAAVFLTVVRKCDVDLPHVERPSEPSRVLGYTTNDVLFYASGSSLVYLLYLTFRSGAAAKRTMVWLVVNFVQSIILFLRGSQDLLAPKEKQRLLILSAAQILWCHAVFLFSLLSSPRKQTRQTQSTGEKNDIAPLAKE